MLFGINFAMGVATGLTMEFEFGTNWAYYAHYVGDIFGAPLAIEGLMAFFLEATFIGLFFFGWNRLTRVQHLIATCADGARHQPVGAVDPDRQRLDAVPGRRALQRRHHAHGGDRLLRRAVQPGGAGQVRAHGLAPATSPARCSCCRSARSTCCAAATAALAIRSMTVAASFGLASALSVVVLGDESGYTAGLNQKMKIAAIEAMWQTEPAPASFTVFGIPDIETHETDDAIRVPWVLGLIATRSIARPGGRASTTSCREAELRIKSGMIAYGAMQTLRAHPDDAAARAAFDAHVDDLGYALLLKRYTPNVTDAGEDLIAAAALDTIPPVLPLFFTFRIMVALGFYFIALFGDDVRAGLAPPAGAPPLAAAGLPVVAAAALDRRRTRLGASPRSAASPGRSTACCRPSCRSPACRPANVWISIAGFVLFYSVLAVVEVYLMVRTIRHGPERRRPRPTRRRAAAAPPNRERTR